MKILEPSGVYMRSLPSPAIDFSSDEGKQLFIEACQNGHTVGFFKLIPQFVTQSEPAYCGLASLAMVLNALSIDPRRKWKGIWRWFDEGMLDCVEPLEKVKVKGITFGKVVCLAHCAGADVQPFHTNHSNVDEFRSFVASCTSSQDVHMIASYHRQCLGQTGSGHFCPIGGYDRERDMVLLLDVARFKYPPHWVPISALWTAMDTVDADTNRHRGYMLLSRKQTPHSSLHDTRSYIDDESWLAIGEYVTIKAPLLLSSNKFKNVKDVISTIFSSLPPKFFDFIKNVSEIHQKEYSADQNNDVNISMQKLVQGTSLHKHVSDTLCCGDNYSSMNEDQYLLTKLLLALPFETWSAFKDKDAVYTQICSLVSIDSLPSLLQDEVLHIRGQLIVVKGCLENCT